MSYHVSRRWRGDGGHAWIAAIMHVSRRWREMATLASYVSLGTEVNVLAAHDCQACVPSRPRFVPRKALPFGLLHTVTCCIAHVAKPFSPPPSHIHIEPCIA